MFIRNLLQLRRNNKKKTRTPYRFRHPNRLRNVSFTDAGSIYIRHYLLSRQTIYFHEAVQGQIPTTPPVIGSSLEKLPDTLVIALQRIAAGPRYGRKDFIWKSPQEICAVVILFSIILRRDRIGFIFRAVFRSASLCLGDVSPPGFVGGRISGRPAIYSPRQAFPAREGI